MGCHSCLQGIFLSHTYMHLYISIYQGSRVENLRTLAGKPGSLGSNLDFEKPVSRVPWSRFLSPSVLRAWPVTGRTPGGNEALPRRYSPGHTAGAPPPPGSQLPALPSVNATFQVPSSAWQMLETRRRETTDMLKTQSRVSSHAATSLPAARGTRGDWTRLVAAVAPGPPCPGPGQL